jgi:uncharacterized protein (DUF58 family)
MVSVVLPPVGLFPGEETAARVEARLPRAAPPGFSVHLALPLAWQDRRICSAATRAPPGSSRQVVRFRARWRGAYASTVVLVECRDILGFTAGRFSLPFREQLTVYPALRDPGAAARFMEQADESAVESRQRRRSEDLLEARKYYPGDDVRRLNWKVFAHLNELFVRVGEEVPPPESRLLFVLDTTVNPLVPRALRADYLDGLVSSCVSVADALQDARREVMLSQPGQRECRSFGSRAALLTHAADVAWTDAAWTPDLPTRPLHVAVFSSPGSPGLSRIMATVRSRGWSSSLFIKALEPVPPRAQRGMIDLLFLPRDGAAGRRAEGASEKERRALSEAAARDVASWTGGKVRHAAEV